MDNHLSNVEQRSRRGDNYLVQADFKSEVSYQEAKPTAKKSDRPLEDSADDFVSALLIAGLIGSIALVVGWLLLRFPSVPLFLLSAMAIGSMFWVCLYRKGGMVLFGLFAASLAAPLVLDLVERWRELSD